VIRAISTVHPSLSAISFARLPPEFHDHFRGGAGHLADLLGHVHRDVDGAALVGNGPLDRLPDPPGRVGLKRVSPVRIEFFHGLHQPDVALLNQILELQAYLAILLGHADDEAKVLLDQLLPGLLVSGMDPLAKLLPFLPPQELLLPYTREALRQ